MKKKIIIISLLLVIAIVLLAIPKSTYAKLFKKNDDPIKPIEYNYYQTVYVSNDKEQLVGLKIGVEEIAEDSIRQKWDLLTADETVLPTGYSTILAEVVLNEYEIKDNILTLSVNDKIYEAKGKIAAAALAWTFCYNSDPVINEVILKVGDEIVKQIGDFQYKNINTDLVVNYQYETNYLYEANVTTIIHYENNLIIPVTYFYLADDACDFIVSKIFDPNLINNEAYTYTLNTESIVLTLGLEEISNQSDLNTLIASVEYNFKIKDITVNGQNDVIYKTVSTEVNEETKLA